MANSCEIKQPVNLHQLEEKLGGYDFHEENAVLAKVTLDKKGGFEVEIYDGLNNCRFFDISSDGNLRVSRFGDGLQSSGPNPGRKEFDPLTVKRAREFIMGGMKHKEPDGSCKDPVPAKRKFFP